MSTLSTRFENQTMLGRLKIGLLTLLVIVVFGLPQLLDEFYVSLMYTILLFVVLTGALNIQSGYTGYINFGFSLFVGIGMYTTALGMTGTGQPYVLLWIVSGLVTALIAAILSYPLLRVSGVYFSIAILAVALGARAFVSLPSVATITRGGEGISFYRDIPLNHHYYAMAILAVLVVVTTHFVATRKLGLELLAIRENEPVLQTLGIQPKVRKIGVFIGSGFFAGVAGGINATYLLYIDPSLAFSLDYTIQPIAMAMIGGFGTVWGPVIGAVLIKAIEQLLWSQFLQFNTLFFGIIVILGVLLVPEGIVRRAQHSGLISWSRKW